MSEIQMKISGMSCQHCVMAVKKALNGLGGILESDIAIGSADVKYDESKVSKSEIIAAIEEAGYSVTNG